MEKRAQEKLLNHDAITVTRNRFQQLEGSLKKQNQNKLDLRTDDLSNFT